MMKKLLVLVVAVLFSTAIVDANVVPNNSVNTTNAEMMAPVYWQGWAQAHKYYSLYITVYRSANTCDGYYAVATKRRYNPSGVETSINVELIVKTKNGGYYVTYDGTDYDFQM